MLSANHGDTDSVDEVRAGTAFYVVAGIVLPSLGLALGDFLAPEWQSGDRRDFWSAWFSTEVGVLFVPALVFSASGIVLARRRGSSPGSIARVALFTGVVLSFQYLLLLASLAPEIFGFGLLHYASCTVFHQLRCRGYVHRTGFVLGWLLAPGLGLIAKVGLDLELDDASKILPGYAFFWVGSAIAAAPLFSLTAYLTLWRRSAGNALPGLAWPPWLLGYGASVALAVRKVDEVYRALPTEPPDCYVATASARGHRWLTGSWDVVVKNGRVLAVTRQMQVLKAAERMLRERTPRLHASLRRRYDRVGPRLASRLGSRWLADAAYLGLKPCEWLRWLVLVVSSRRPSRAR